MVDGVEVKVPLFLWLFTVFVMFLALMNPLVKLECQGDKCKKKYVSKFDGKNYTDWYDTDMQATGNLTLEKLTYGYVNCENKCDDCNDTKKECKGWEYDGMKYFDSNLTNWSNHIMETENITLVSKLPSFLTTLCVCSDFCVDCNDGLIALPDAQTNNAKWVDMECKKMEAELNQTGSPTASGNICGLVNLYKKAYIVIITCLVFMGLLQLTMLGLEYINFDSFLDGRCSFLFCPYLYKKLLYISLACICLSLQLYTFITVRTETDEKLDAYSTAIKANFKYNWDTRGLYMFGIAIGGSCLTIFTMVFFMKKVERQKKKSYRHDVHGISTTSVLNRKF